LTLTLSISAVLVAGQGAIPGPDAPQADPPLYLPLVGKLPNGVYGRVYDNGVAASGVSVMLLLYNGSVWSSIASTTTNLNGEYVFPGINTLSPGQKYVVAYNNPEHNSSRLWYWETRQLSEYTSGSAVNIGNFDIANLPLSLPLHNTLVSLPQTFSWTPRPASPTDSYVFDLFDYFDYVPNFSTAPLGYVSSYNLASLPAGFLNCIPYTWGLTILGPDSSWGFPYYVRAVTLYNAAPSGIHGCVAQAGVPANSIQVQLHRVLTVDPFTDTTVDTRSTNANGYFAFTGQPALDATHAYFVKYANDSVETRLFRWYTQALFTYAGSSSVHIGDFDIANVPLGLPIDGATVALPETFSWVPRPATLSDSYVFDLFEACGGCPYFDSYPPLGYVNTYELTGLPPGFSFGTQYWWDIWIYHPYDDGYGISFWANAVTFTPTGLSAAPAAPAAALPEAQRLQSERLLRNLGAGAQTQPGLSPDEGWPPRQK
jgi:5-hydroxyisourate hydrolase-like protein (transthyretin family)